MQTQLKEKEVLTLYDRHVPREVIPVHEEPPLPGVIETRYIPYKPAHVPVIPPVPDGAIREAATAAVDNAGQLFAWTVFAVLRAGGVVLLILAHVVRGLGLILKAVVTGLLSGITSGAEDEDTAWEPGPRRRAEQNININITQNNY